MLVFSFVLVLTLLAYFPGLSGKFAFDDGPNILHNPSVAIQSLSFVSIKQAAFSSSSGTLKRPISMLSFALNYYETGFNPYYFKLVNVVLHLINGVLLFILTGLILRVYQRRFQHGLELQYIRWVSLAVMAAWLLHPLNLTGVLYVVQRMTSLAALFTICGLIFYLMGRLRLLDDKPGGKTLIISGLLVFLPLAVFSKENGALLPAFMLLAELTLFSLDTGSLASKRFLRIFLFLVAVLPITLGMFYLLAHPAFILAGYKTRDFTLFERLLTEARVLWFYIEMILLPRTEVMGLFHDDIPISHSLLDPFSTLIAVSGLLAMLAVAVALRKRQPLIAFGVLFFFVGHSLESTIFSLEITFEHRNYLPMYGILLIVFYYALYPLTHLKSLHLRRFGVIALILLFATGTAIRSQHWGNLYLLNLTEVEHHPLSNRANSEAGAMYGILALTEKQHSEQYFELARKYFEKSASLKKVNTDGLFGLIYYASILGKPIERPWLDDLSRRLGNAPFESNSASKLVDLVACRITTACKISKEDIKLLLDAAVHNSTLSGLSRAAVFFALSYHLANVERDTKGALDATYQAMRAVPNEPEYRANLIGFLIALNRLEEAGTQLKLAREIDVLGTYTRKFDEFERMLKPHAGTLVQ